MAYPHQCAGPSVANLYEGDYPGREIDCQDAMEPGFQAIVDCMIEAGGEVARSLRRLVAADNMTQRGNAQVEAELAIARAMLRAGKAL
ncbi:hypothetical protein SAMN03159463_02306 [Mesorhizobium sp. NFR06]|uniref:hypothetical protein n=1 Tax=Mesorhizobium sp. NFR06 TaxID=1566290 RepID=UPI0008DF2216|nr:hypothetical protein [Mesorhizobium sp. NFR06]SFO57103.1 hypothetical protein SAMN03159463_02306 [Mesorhizobium sp. NFR06]